MKRFSTIIGKRSESSPSSAATTPDSTATNAIKNFCESGGPNTLADGEEAIYLPVIVEACESSPTAATAAARQLRKMIKDNYKRAYMQYNAIMLFRILTDNPGPRFTKNIDSKFVDAIKVLLSLSLDPSVQALMRETLNALAREKSGDENLGPLLTMWTKQSRKAAYPQYPLQPTIAENLGAPSSRRSSRRDPRKLPPPHELAGRIEEAKTSAKLLVSLVQSTPLHEFRGNELIPEFSERCASAQRSMQGYLNADPSPDDETARTLIEACEQISIAQSKHQRQALEARRAYGAPSGTPTSGGALSPPPLAAGPSNGVSSASTRNASPYDPHGDAARSASIAASKPSVAAATAPASSSSFSVSAASPPLSATGGAAAGTAGPSLPTIQPERPLSNPFDDAASDNSPPTRRSDDSLPPASVPAPLNTAYNYGRAPHPEPNTFELPVQSHAPPGAAYDSASNGVVAPVPTSAGVQRSASKLASHGIYEAPGGPSTPTVAAAPALNGSRAPPPAAVRTDAPLDEDEDDLYAVSPARATMEPVASSPARVKPAPPPSRKPLNS